MDQTFLNATASNDPRTSGRAFDAGAEQKNAVAAVLADKMKRCRCGGLEVDWKGTNQWVIMATCKKCRRMWLRWWRDAWRRGPG